MEAMQIISGILEMNEMFWAWRRNIKSRNRATTCSDIPPLEVSPRYIKATPALPIYYLQHFLEFYYNSELDTLNIPLC